MALTCSTDPLVWIDCEMTGLNPDTDTILSLACFITDAQLSVLDPDGFETIIHHPKSRLDLMDEWCTRTHCESGLTASCIASTTTATGAAQDLEAYIRDTLGDEVIGRREALLAGNSVHVDKLFLMRKPWDGVLGLMGYRILDVSAIKEGVRRWAGEEVVAEAPRKMGRHTAREDILESLEEARYYMGLFKGMRAAGEPKRKEDVKE